MALDVDQSAIKEFILTYPGSERRVRGGDIVVGESCSRSRMVVIEELEKVISGESRLNLQLKSSVV